jgi:hypothetical protein
MRHIFCLLMILMTAQVIYANPMVIEGEYKYIYSDSESIVDAKRKCLDFAKKDALEKFATYISSESVVKNYQTEKDEIISSTLGIVKNIQVVEEKIDKVNNSIYYKVTAEVNEQEILDELRKKYGTAELKIKVTDLITTGDRAEKELKIGEALRNFYWALLMLKSDPAGSNLKCEQFDSRLLSIVLPEKIEGIFSDIKYEISDVVESIKYKGITIDAKYRGKPVKSLDFKFFNGEEWSKSIPVRDGRASVDLYGDAANVVAMLLINTEYKYEDMAYHNEAVKEVMATSLQIPFQGSSAKLAITSSKPKQPADVTEQPRNPVVQQPTQTQEVKQPTNAAERLAMRQRELEKEKDKKQTQTQPQIQTATPSKQPAVQQKLGGETSKDTQPYGMKTNMERGTEFCIYFTFSRATGDFADNSADSWLDSSGGDAIKDELWRQGYASFGFGFGYTAAVPLGNTGLYFMTDLALIFSPVDENLFEEWCDNYGLYDYEVGMWMNMPVMLGLMYKKYFNDIFGLYGFATGGFNMAVGPTYYFEYYDYYSGQNYYWEFKSPTPTFTGAFSSGIGITVGRLDIATKYMYLGNSEMEYLNWNDVPLTMERKISMLVTTIGVVINAPMTPKK